MGDHDGERRHGEPARSEPGGVTTRILIALDATYFRRGIEDRLGAEPDFEVVATADNGPSALDALVEAAPAVVLIDGALPAPAGFETIPRIKRELPSAAIIVLVEIDDADSLFAAIKSGAAALLGQAVGPDDLVATIRRVAAGAYLINDLVATKPVVAGRVLDEFRRLLAHDPAAAPIFRPLSAREFEVLKDISRGMSNKEVGAALSISEQTVKNHMTNILRKLAVNDRTHAVVFAMRQGWIRMSDT
jgi:DNA-binding NarL/FixJ family response regulator